MNSPYKEAAFPSFIKSLIFTFSPIAAKAIISSLLLNSLNTCDNPLGINLREHNVQVIKNPITYQSTLKKYIYN